MAEEDENQEEGAEEAGEGGGAEDGGKSGGLKKILLIAVGLLLIIGISVGGTLMLVGGGSQPPADEMMDPAIAIEQMPAEEQMVTPDQGEAIYLALKPEFIINYNTGARQRFLQTEITVLARDQLAVDAITQHMPLIRNNIIEMLSQKNYDELRTDEGRQQLAEDLSITIQDTLLEIIGRPGIERILYRSFVMQ